MKTPLAIAGIVLFALCSCQKSIDAIPTSTKNDVINNSSNKEIEYNILKGTQYCDKNTFQQINTSELKFMVKFDSSAIYTTTNPANQVDINKLYGFSDNNADHHSFSARFGWRWRNNQLQIFGYNYNNGVMSFQQIGIATIGVDNACSIKIAGNAYVFSFNENTITMPRSSTTSTAIGYKLFPYFGGTEMAPQDIKIRIKDL